VQFWASENPRVIHEKVHHASRITVWVTISGHGLLEPIFFEETVNSVCYLSILRKTFMPHLLATGLIKNKLEMFHCTWKASSLVGVSTSANIPYGSSHNFCRIGRANAKVLPLPVLAHPIQSSPARMRGMQLIWMGVGCFSPETLSKTATLLEKYLGFLNYCPPAKIYHCHFHIIDCIRKPTTWKT
jgi:hypothetical protein